MASSHLCEGLCVPETLSRVTELLPFRQLLLAFAVFEIECLFLISVGFLPFM